MEIDQYAVLTDERADRDRLRMMDTPSVVVRIKITFHQYFLFEPDMPVLIFCACMSTCLVLLFRYRK